MVPPVGTIDIRGLEKAKVLAALYNNSKAQGVGLIEATFTPKSMSVSKARKVIEERQPFLNFDYLHGRILKIDISGDKLDPRWYDRDNGPGAAARAIGSLRTPRRRAARGETRGKPPRARHRRKSPSEVMAILEKTTKKPMKNPKAHPPGGIYYVVRSDFIKPITERHHKYLVERKGWSQEDSSAASQIFYRMHKTRVPKSEWKFPGPMPVVEHAEGKQAVVREFADPKVAMEYAKTFETEDQEPRIVKVLKVDLNKGTRLISFYVGYPKHQAVYDSSWRKSKIKTRYFSPSKTKSTPYVTSGGRGSRIRYVPYNKGRKLEKSIQQTLNSDRDAYQIESQWLNLVDWYLIAPGVIAKSAKDQGKRVQSKQYLEVQKHFKKMLLKGIAASKKKGQIEQRHSDKLKELIDTAIATGKIYHRDATEGITVTWDNPMKRSRHRKSAHKEWAHDVDWDWDPERRGSPEKKGRKKNPKKKAVKKKAAKKKAKTPPYQLLINRCQKLWTHYCERPSKKRLEAVYVHLDKMKESTSKKVKAERTRCLRSANAEAKKLKYTRKK